MERKALVLGATGLVGSHLVDVLVNERRYSEIIVLARRKLETQNPKVKAHAVNMEELDRYEKEFMVDDIYCCLGTTMKKAGSREAFTLVDYKIPMDAAKIGSSAGAKQFLVISSMGADKGSPFFYNRVKGTLETDIIRYPYQTIHIFRPSLLLGKRAEFRLGEKLGEWIMKPVFGLLKGRFKKYTPIEAGMVAKAMANAALAGSKGVIIHESDEILSLSRKRQ